MANKFVAAALLALTMATAPAFADAVKVKKVIVETEDLTAVENKQAAHYFASIDTDLKAAIETRLAQHALASGSDEGADVTVKLKTVELANSLQMAADVADANLQGQVNVFEDGNAVTNFGLEVSARQALVYLPAGTELSALTLDTPIYYNALINGFADVVVARIAEAK